jgi:molecular chaperone GrpE
MEDRVEIRSGDEASAPAPAKEGGAAPEERPEGASGAKVVDRRRRYGEDGDSAGAEAAEPVKVVPTYVEQLERKVALAEEKLKEHIERLNREAAEFRARQERELERRTIEARKRVVAGFLPIAEDLGRALAAAPAPESAGSAGGLIEGIRLIQGRFFQELAAQGVVPIPALGERFDPSLHEALLTREVSDPSQDGMVVEELGQGYRLGEEVIRPSRVAVGKLRAQGAAPAP